MGRQSRIPPVPVGEITLTMYSSPTWDDARVDASEWQIDLGLYVEYALRRYHAGKLSKMRLARWRHEQDEKDPDLRRIRDFLKAEDEEPQPRPEYMKDEYLPKSRRRGKRGGR